MTDDLDASLVAYYDAEAAAGARVEQGELRTTLRGEFARLLSAEGRRTVLDVGAGPGLDVAGFTAAGLVAFGLDLAPGNVVVMRDRGVAGVVGSIYDLPMADGALDAVWTMSTLVHVPDTRLSDAVAELLRVVRPGGPVAIGSWGGRDWEGSADFTRFDPPRFFSLRAHDRWHAFLASVAQVEHVASYTTEQPGWEYQFAVLRALEST